MNCEDCAFWARDRESQDIEPGGSHPKSRPSVKGAECRRNAPSAVSIDGQAQGYALWPWTEPYDWCGEWKREKDEVKHPNVS